MKFYFRKSKIIIDTFLFHRSFEMPEKLIISPEVDQIRIDPKGVELRESWRMNMDVTPKFFIRVLDRKVWLVCPEWKISH